MGLFRDTTKDISLEANSGTILMDVMFCGKTYATRRKTLLKYYLIF